MELQSLKQRYDIIGDDQQLNRALDIAVQVAATDLSVLVTGESGVGKENIPLIIHNNSPRKHNIYIAINCGAIPEGTIDSELFGHEKGSFTGATETRKGYFEAADGGTIFLDEVGELPLSTQVRLLRVLQNGEFYKVGSSKVQKTNVRVVAATNVNLLKAIEEGKFREDLYYRLNTVPIFVPPLRERSSDIFLLFRKFALDFADKYRMPVIKLTHDARIVLQQYRWPGNIRQLKSVAEQISVLESNREITAETLRKYLPKEMPERLPVLNSVSNNQRTDIVSDRDLLYKLIFQLKQEVATLKEQVERISPLLSLKNGNVQEKDYDNYKEINEFKEYREVPDEKEFKEYEDINKPKEEETSLSIPQINAELIRKSLEKHHGKRKDAAAELGISERTLYRKIKELKL